MNKLDLVPEGVNDTVGAIALDSNGTVASAVSTGGNSLKFPGRIGHVSLSVFTSTAQSETLLLTNRLICRKSFGFLCAANSSNINQCHT